MPLLADFQGERGSAKLAAGASALLGKRVLHDDSRPQSGRSLRERKTSRAAAAEMAGGVPGAAGEPICIGRFSGG